MSSILAPRPADRPPQREDWGTGVTISVAAHLALIGALIWGVHWHSNPEPEGVTAELWSALPQAAAPRPQTAETPPSPPPPAPTPRPPAPVPAPPPPPAVQTPKPPDIVTEREAEKKKLEQQRQQQQAKQDQIKAQKDAQAKADEQQKQLEKQQAAKQQQLDAQKLAKLHAENLKRMMGQMDAPADSTGTAARSSGPSANYLGRIIARLKPNVVFQDSVPGNPAVEVEIRCAPDGTIIGRRITRSSGAPSWDEAVLRAIDRTGTLPRDTDGRTPAVIPVIWRPQDTQ